MSIIPRKFFIWLISLAAVLAIYLLYNRMSETPPIKIGTAAETVDDSNAGRFDGQIGMIGSIGVRAAQNAKYIHLNSKKQVDREFGFEKLLAESENEWEIEKPFMNIFRHNIRCYLTADRGTVQIETVVGRPNPEDAVLTGNVVIRLLPVGSSRIKQSTIYLDDIAFVSEKSLFSTNGPVKFVNEDAQMLGRGLEIVYNEELDRLEYLRIINLEILRLKTSSGASLFFQTTPTGKRQAGTAELSSEKIDVIRPDGAAAAANRQKAKVLPPSTRQPDMQKQGEYYKCVFSKNVVIDTPEQLVLADVVFINDIFFEKSSNEKSTEPDTVDTGTEESISSAHSRAGNLNKNNAIADNVPVAGPGEPEQSSEEFVDIVITCDGGIIIVPMDYTGAYGNPVMPDTGDDGQTTKDIDDANGRTIFVARRIDYNASTDQTVAVGPSELTFYPKDVIGTEPNEKIVPVKITAGKKASFSPALNQVIFEGDSLCTMVREDRNSRQQYTLSAPRLTVNLSKDKASAADIDHLTADGGTVRLATVKTAGEKQLGGIELKCSRFDYDTTRQMCLAVGPGVIKVINFDIAEPNAEVDGFSLRRPSYVLVENFDTLKYFLESNRIIADAGTEKISIGYVPVVKGRYGQVVNAAAAHIEVLLYETADARLELLTLSAAGGITYEDEDKQFVGSEMFYDAGKSVITAWGDESQPCLLNGALVDGIEYNLKTGKIKTKIVAPGAFEVNAVKNPANKEIPER